MLFSAAYCAESSITSGVITLSSGAMKSVRVTHSLPFHCCMIAMPEPP